MILQTQAEFARSQGWERSYVTKLKQHGRLVMGGEKGDKVDVDASLALIASTEGGRSDVADRHAQDRKKNAASANSGGGKADKAALTAHRETKAGAEARLAGANAALKEMELQRELGNLIAKEHVDFVLQDFGATFRGLLDNLADRLAPVVYPLQTLEETHAQISQQAEAIQNEMAEAMRRRVGDGV